MKQNFATSHMEGQEYLFIFTTGRYFHNFCPTATNSRRQMKKEKKHLSKLRKPALRRTAFEFAKAKNTALNARVFLSSNKILFSADDSFLYSFHSLPPSETCGFFHLRGVERFQRWENRKEREEEPRPVLPAAGLSLRFIFFSLPLSISCSQYYKPQFSKTDFSSSVSFLFFFPPVASRHRCCHLQLRPLDSVATLGALDSTRPYHQEKTPFPSRYPPSLRPIKCPSPIPPYQIPFH